MIIPGEYPLTIIRGLAFDEVIFQAKDENLSVTGTLSPDATGLYIPCGTFAADGFGKPYPLFILAGSPSYFCYFNTTAASYVIADLLTNAALTDFWLPSSPLTEPTGTYAPQGANTGTAIGSDHPLDLTGFGVEGVIKKDVSPSSPIFAPLNPSVTDPTNGEFTIPGMTYTVTEALTAIGAFYYDIVATNSGERVGILVWGPVNVSDNITQPS